MRVDHSLGKAKAERRYRLALVAIILSWLTLNLVLCSMLASDPSGRFIYAFFFLSNFMFAYGFYCWWTAPVNQRLRDDLRRRHHLHALPEPRDPRHTPDDQQPEERFS